MSSRTLLNLGLLLLIVILAALVILEPGIEEEAPPTPLTHLEPTAVDRIILRRPGHEPVTLSRHDGGWWVERDSGPEVPANAMRVSNLQRLAAAESHSRFTPGSGELEKYGLSDPRAVVRLGDQSIAFGDTDPLNNRRYVLVDGVVHLITDSYYRHVIAEASSFYDKALLPGNPAINGLRVPGLTLNKSPQGQWLAEPEVDVSADNLNALVDEWRYAQAMEVQTAVERGAAAGEVVVDTSDGEFRFKLYEEDGERVLVRDDLSLAYVFARETAQRLFDPAAHEPAVEPGDEGMN